jgi:hypothetical protein
LGTQVGELVAFMPGSGRLAVSLKSDLLPTQQCPRDWSRTGRSERKDLDPGIANG